MVVSALSHAELAERAGLPIVTIDQAGRIGSRVRPEPAAIRAILEGQGVLFVKGGEGPRV
jgi:hypothetical protein